MILHNTTFVLAEADVIEFLEFMKAHYLPILGAGGRVKGVRLHRIQQELGDMDSVRYAMHYYLPNHDTLDELCESEIGLASEALQQAFGERVLGFSTVMEEVIL